LDRAPLFALGAEPHAAGRRVVDPGDCTAITAKRGLHNPGTLIYWHWSAVALGYVEFCRACACVVAGWRVSKSVRVLHDPSDIPGRIDNEVAHAVVGVRIVVGSAAVLTRNQLLSPPHAISTVASTASTARLSDVCTRTDISLPAHGR